MLTTVQQQQRRQPLASKMANENLRNMEGNTLNVGNHNRIDKSLMSSSSISAFKSSKTKSAKSQSSKSKSKSKSKPGSSSSSTTSSTASSSLNNMDGSNSTTLRPLPIQTSGIEVSTTNAKNGSKSNKSNNNNHNIGRGRRSISPHARAILSRTFSRSRSRSRSRSLSSRLLSNEDDHNIDDNSSVVSSTSSSSATSQSHNKKQNQKQILVAVLSCRSDAYIAQKAPGSTSMLPRKAPSALKNFHELAVGVKDAYESMGAMPVKLEEGSEEYESLSDIEREGRKVLFEFMGNLNFLLALVDEVATDSATRGALKDDNAFKNLRDVIKKCNKVLERMLIRRENKYTLFFRLVQLHDIKDLVKMKTWNQKVESAVRALSNDGGENSAITMTGVNGSGSGDASVGAEDGDAMSVTSEASTESSSKSSSKGLMSRGRAMFKTAGRVRTRRATPTPRMRTKGELGGKSMADDGFARSTPVATSNLDQLNLDGKATSSSSSSSGLPDALQKNKQPVAKASNKMFLAPKDELVGMIRDLKQEKAANETGVNMQNQLQADLKPNWLPKADIPTTVPILPVEYIHRHRLMKQVVNSLINCSGSVEDESKAHIITSITSRHADKAGNGKTTLAVAAIQSVEVRERFSDGIAWIHIGRAPLADNDVRRLYEELYDQLMQRDIDVKENEISPSQSEENQDILIANSLSRKKRNFQGNDLQGMKEELGRIISKKSVLVCLDDVWRLEDAERFTFDSLNAKDIVTDSETGKSTNNAATCPYRILITTRSPGLMGPDGANEVYVRIFSEHEAVKLLLYSSGRRLHGGKSAPAFQQARVIVKGCGNSPLALRLAGGMLRTSNRNWTLSSPAWISLVEQCKASLEEASRIRSFINSVGRIVDMSFMTVSDHELRASLRRCFVTFATVFHDNEWLLTGKGIPRGIVKRLFYSVISGMRSESDFDTLSPDNIIDMLEHMNLLYKARHGTTNRMSSTQYGNSQQGKSLMNGCITFNSLSEDSADDDGTDEESHNDDGNMLHIEHTSYIMHESIKHIAEEMSMRLSATFAPKADKFTPFVDELHVEEEKETKPTSWFSNAAKFLFSSSQNSSSRTRTTQKQFHELMVGVLDDRSSNNSIDTQSEGITGLNVERYILSFLPSHLIQAEMFEEVSALLLDFEFINRRINMIGALEATKRHMIDLADLKRHFQRKSKENKAGKKSNQETKGEVASHDSKTTGANGNDGGTPHSQESSKFDMNVDVSRTQREACRRVIDAIRRAEFQTSSSSENSINIAVCLSIVAEFLLKARLTRDAVSRFEESLELFKKLLGESHVDVARAMSSLGRSCIKAGEEQKALVYLTDAHHVYESCNALHQHDAISNNLLTASLLVSTGDWENATMKYDEVIDVKQEVYGNESIEVAKTINDYAIILAKNNRMSESLRQYEAARCVYIAINRQDKFSFDITLIDLNIASIKSKLGNYQGALESYERGVKGLRLQIKKEKENVDPDSDNSRLAAQKRHLVSAMGRIGSMRMKLKDNAGALKAYLMLIKDVDKKSMTQSQIEKARAHVKCATIFRQTGTSENNALAISHLSQALQMYTSLHGANHKDTKAIESSLKQWQKTDTAA